MKVYKPVFAALIAFGMISNSFAAYGKSPASSRKASHYGYASMKSSKCASAVQSGNSYASKGHYKSCWSNRVAVSGDLTAVLGSFSDDNGTIKGDSMSWTVRNVNLAVDAHINRNLMTHVLLSHQGIDPWTTAQSRSIEGVATGAVALGVSEAFFVYKNDDVVPMTVKLGKGFTSFGNVSNPFAVAPTLTQALTQFNTQTLDFGFKNQASSDMSFNGNVFLYNTNTESVTKDKTAFGLKAGFGTKVSGAKLNGNVSFVTDYAPVVKSASTVIVNTAATITKAKSAFNVRFDGSYQGFKAGVDFTSAGSLDADNADTTKLATFGVNLAYGTDMNGMPMSFGAFFEDAGKKSEDIVTFKTAMGVNATVGVWKNFNLGLNFNQYKHTVAAGVEIAFPVEH